MNNFKGITPEEESQLRSIALSQKIDKVAKNLTNLIADYGHISYILNNQLEDKHLDRMTKEILAHIVHLLFIKDNL